MKKVILLCLFTCFITILSAQIHLEVEGDTWIKGRLELNQNGQNFGEYIWNPNGYDLRFYTANKERLRINDDFAGGDIMIFEMDTITSAQDITAGNVVRLSDGTLALRQYNVGDMAQGGIVFWVDETGEHGLVSMTSDLESPAGDFEHKWSSVDEYTGATGDGIGAGAMNTMLIISAQREDTESAARLSADLVENGYADWYLPSFDELIKMFQNIGKGVSGQNSNIGGFANDWYWSSTEIDNRYVRHIYFGNGLDDSNRKFPSQRVRAIRAF